MELLDRYLFEVGRHLAPNQRADILSELRSSLEDALEARGDEPTDEAVVAVLREMGAPREVAASYYPEGQYLIGPALYPLFRFVVGVALTAVVGAQLIIVMASLAFPASPLSIVSEVGGILGSIPLTFGVIVLIFAALQKSDIRPEWHERAWDPRTLPSARAAEPINTFEVATELVVSTILLVWLARFAAAGGFAPAEQVSLLTNPVVDRLFPLIALFLAIDIVFDIVLLWQGRWLRTTRIAKVATHLVTVGILAVIIRGHLVWLADRGITDLVTRFTHLPALITTDVQAAGMLVFLVGFAVALVVTLIEVAIQLFRLARGTVQPTVTILLEADERPG